MTAAFHTTRWSVVRAASGDLLPEARVALEELCASYWYPLYAFLRREGRPEEDARDLVQGFFADFLRTGGAERADPERGRFRSYLLGALKHHVRDAHAREQALKRGGGRAPLSFELEDAEQRYSVEPSHDLTPERLFERRWALSVLERALATLQEEQARRGRERVFLRLKGYLSAGEDEGGYRQAGADLGLSEGAVKVNVHRLRARYGELIREEVSHTVSGPEEVEAELQALFEALSTPPSESS